MATYNQSCNKFQTLHFGVSLSCVFFMSFSWWFNYVSFRTGYGPYDYVKFRTGNKRPPSPLNLTLFKSDKNVALTRNFSDNILHNPIAIQFFNSLHDMYIADESFYNTFATLDFLPNGSFVQNFHKDLSHGMGSTTQVEVPYYN